ncbi:MAG: zinc-dependent alcohol dehydrogenase family protein [Steroidobacteraceae bacterium]|nr:zinc-dependent alcohol dehydrogenase family protein [Steroidobacteraceae bacterium]
MKALWHERYGEPRDVLRLVDLPVETPGPGEVVVRMEAAAMHIADVRTVQGVPGLAKPLPRSPGYEGVGRIARVGPGVADWREGERVFPPIGSGTFREELRVAAGALLPAPEGDPLQLAFLTINPPTAWCLLHDFVTLAPGEWLVQNCANSNVGRYLTVLAHRAGVRTAAVVRREELAPELRALGADAVLLDGSGLAARVRDATGGAAIRLGIDAVAGDGTQRIADCLADGSRLVVYGAMSREPCRLEFYSLLFRDVTVCGFSTTRQLQKRTGEERRELYDRLAALVADGTLPAKVARAYSLADGVAAFEHALRVGPDRPGKIVLRCA